MAKHMRRWMWAGAMAGTLALGTACSSTEAPIVVAQADTSTTTGQQPATGGSGSTTSPSTTPSTTPDTMTQDPSQAPANPGTVPATPEQNPGSTPVPSDSTTAPGTTTTAPGTSPTFDGDAGMGGSGVVPGTTDDNTTDTFQPPAGGAVMDGGTF